MIIALSSMQPNTYFTAYLLLRHTCTSSPMRTVSTKEVCSATKVVHPKAYVQLWVLILSSFFLFLVARSSYILNYIWLFLQDDIKCL